MCLGMMGLKLALAGHLLLQASVGGMPVQHVSAAEPQCPVQKSARVDVRWRTNPVKYDFTRPISRLNAAELDTHSPYGAGADTEVGGLMSGNIRYESNIQVSSIRFSAGRTTCLWVDKVLVDIIIDPIVYVASEFPQGTCRHNAILEHEHKHVALDRAIVRDHLEGIRQATATAVQQVGVVGPKPDGQAESYKKRMSEHIHGAIRGSTEVMFSDRVKRQLALDNRQEYDRVSAQCPQ